MSKYIIIRNSLTLVLSLFLLLLISCLEDTWIIDKTSSQQTVLSIKEAQKYFNENITEFHLTSPVFGRSIDEEPLAVPLWERGKKITFKKKEVIEVPIEAPVTVVSRLYSLADKNKQKGKYANTIYRLIAERLEDGSYLYTTARITLDDECMHERKKSRKHLTMSLGNLKGFSGGIRYYSINGEFLTGNIYIDGIKRYIISSSEKQDTVSSRSIVMSRSHTECEEHVYQVEHYSCTDVYVEGVLMNSSCVLTDITYETEYVCVEVPDEDDSDNSNEEDDDNSENEVLDETETEIAPKAKKIFRNSNMTEQNWENIEKMLEKIIENCMGGNLYNAIVNYLDGKTLAIEFRTGSNGEFGFQNGTSKIVLGMQMESNQLFHEMWHAYQAYQETTTTWTNALLNLEIETWYAQYLYTSSLPEYKGSRWEKRDRTDPRRIQIKNIKNYVDSHGVLNSNTSQELLDDHIYNYVIPAFREKGYGNYNYDYSRMGTNNFNNLNKLTINCL